MAYPPPPAASSKPSTKVQLHISCKDLRKADVLSKSDPLTAVYTSDSERSNWTEVAAIAELVS